MTSGKVLREARERKGYELDTVARRLRIRPDILRAIEAGDFKAMPPRGYTRNMVNAYAKLLGLNPTEIVNMYLDEVYAYQVEKARGNAPSSGFSMDRESIRTRARSRAMRYDDWEEPTAASARAVRMREEGAGSSLRRDLYDDRTEFSRDDYGVTRERTLRTDRSERDFMSHHSGYSADGYGYDESRRISRRNRDIMVGETPMHYKASRVPAFLKSRVAIAIIAAVVVVLLALGAFALFGNKTTRADDDVSQLPVSGISDTTKTDDAEEESSLASVEIAPTSSRVTYSVKSGEECYIETYTDGGKAEGEQLNGPVEKSIEVTGTWTITTWTPETITVAVDGDVVKLETSEKYGGMAAYTVDFAKILETWKETHSSKEERRSAAVAAANGTASDSAASASTSTTTTQSESSTTGDGTQGAESETTQQNDEGYVGDGTYTDNGYGTYDNGNGYYEGNGYQGYTDYGNGTYDQQYTYYDDGSGYQGYTDYGDGSGYQGYTDYGDGTYYEETPAYDGGGDYVAEGDGSGA